MHILDEVDDTAYVKYIACKILACYTKFPPKNTVAAGAFDAVAAVPTLLLQGPQPRSPARNVALPSLMMRAQPPSNC
jgi:hypothetical protein